MKTLGNMLVGLGVIGILGYVLLVFGLFSMTIYGLVLAFKASILLGVIVFFVEPAPLIIGLCMFFANVNLAEKVLELLK